MTRILAKDQPGSCPVHQDLPWPKVEYHRACRWCGKQVRSTKQSDLPAVCGECKASGVCSRCGAKVMVTAHSRPPETRTCRRCQGGGNPEPDPERDARLWWTDVRP